MSDYSVLHVAAMWRASQAQSKYKDKKVVKNQDGEDTTVYEYSERQVALRDKDKADRIQKLRQRRSDLIKQVKQDFKSKDEKTRLTALAVALIDHTYERPGNEDSADDGHYGVTGWLKKHVTFSGSKATVSYVGKSGVKQKKTVNDAAAVKLLKEITKGKKPDEQIFASDGATITAKDINAYLPEGITAKDLRGLHANEAVRKRLKEIRAKGPKLPADRKEKDRILKDEFKRAVDAAAEIVGHEPSTLRSQYLVPALESKYVHDGTVITDLNEKKAAEVGTDTGTIYAISPEMLHRVVSRSVWREAADDIWNEGVPADFSASWERMSREIREHGGAVLEPGGDGRWDVTIPEAAPHLTEHGLLPPYGTPEFGREAAVPKFRTYEEATAWLEKKYREYGGKNKFLSSDEYREVYPLLKKLSDKARSGLRGDAERAMREAGVGFGDRVEWHQVQPFMMGVDVFTGTLVDKKGIPYVKLDRAIQGKRTMRWHKGFQRVATKSEAEKEEEEVRKLLRPDPKKKPPRQDLRKHRIEEEDEDLKGDRADEDKDRSLNYKHVAALYLARQKAKSEEAAKKLFERYKEENPETDLTWGDFYEKPEEKPKAEEEEPEEKAKAKPEEEPGKPKPEKPEEEKVKEKPTPEAEAVAHKKLVRDTVKDVTQALKSNIEGAALPAAVRGDITTALENMDAEQIKVFKDGLREYGHRVQALPMDGPKAIQRAERALEDLADYDFAAALRANELAQKVMEHAHANAVVKKEKQKQRGKKRQIADAIDQMQAGIRHLTDDPKYVVPKDVKDVLKEQMEGLDADKYEDLIGSIGTALREMQDEDLDAEAALAPAEASLEDFAERIEEMDDLSAKGGQIAEAIQAQRVVQRHQKRQKVERQANKAALDATARIFGEKKLPSGVKEKLERALEGLDLDQKEKYIEGVQAEYQAIKNRIEVDPETGAQRVPPDLLREAVDALREESYEGASEDIARSAARAMAAQTLIADPFTINGQRVGQVALDDAGTRTRGLQAFEKYQELPQQMRTAAASQIQERLKNLEAESPEAKELNRILDGIVLASLVDEREEGKLPQIPGREVNEGFAELARAMAKAGKVDLLLGPVEDFYSPAGQQAVHSAMQSLDDANLARAVKDTMPGMDTYLVGTAETPALPEEKKRHLRQALIDMSVDNMTVVDRLIQSRMEDAGDEKADDPKYRAEKARQATGKSWWQKFIEKHLKPEVPVAKTRTSAASLKLPMWTFRDGTTAKLAEAEPPEESPVLDMRVEYLRTLNDFLTKEIGKPGKSHADRAIQRFLETKNPNFLRSEPETPKEDFETAERKKEGRNSRFSLDSRHVLAAGQPSVRAVEPFFVSKRGKQMSTLTREAAQKVTDDLDRIANLFQHNHESLGVPQKIALDFAYRCDLLSDEIGRLAGGQDKEAYQQGTGEGTAPGSDDNKNLGPPQPFNPAEIGKQDTTPPKTEPDEPYMKGNFLQKEYNELRNWQEQGLFSNAKAASETARQMIAKLQGLQAALETAE